MLSGARWPLARRVLVGLGAVRRNYTKPTTPRLALLTALVLAACEPAPTTTTQLRPVDDVLAGKGIPGGHKCNSVQVTPAAATIPVGGQVTLAAAVLNKKGNVIAGAPVAWASQNASVAVVSSNGTVTGVTPGNSTIVAICTENGVTGTSAISVTP